MARVHTHAVRPGGNVTLHTTERATGLARSILKDLFGPPETRNFQVRLWDGTMERPATGQRPLYTLALRHPASLKRMFLPPSELSVAEAYLNDDFDIIGDIEAATALSDVLAAHLKSPLKVAQVLSKLMSLPDDGEADKAREEWRALGLVGEAHSRERDMQAVRYHYDVGNDFYALWLDSRMVYSCGYFERKDEDIDEAQTAKLEHICRKLRLKPGERLLDIGCGWGGLVMYAAQHYGVYATGITLSEAQATLARERIREAGLSDKCHIEIRDYREMPKGAHFDKIVSVGMHEHVGEAQLPTYFAQAYKLLKPGGLFLNHGIVDLNTRHHAIEDWVKKHVWQEGKFLDRYIFPDGELIPPGRVIDYAEAAGFETRDVESLREHYALTLRQWVHRLEAHHDEAVKQVGEKGYRAWRLYMAGSAHGFAAGKIGIVQTLLSKQAKGGVTGLPLTREDLYREE